MRRCLALAFLAIYACAGVNAQGSPNGARQVVRRIVPVYPDLARRLHLEEAVVKLRVTVAPDGTPKATEVLGGNPVLAKSALDAVSNWRWVPAANESKEIVELTFHR
jgi:TonB family protein